MIERNAPRPRGRLGDGRPAGKIGGRRTCPTIRRLIRAWLLAMAVPVLAGESTATPLGHPLDQARWSAGHGAYPVALSLYASPVAGERRANPVVLYVLNHAMPRTGLEPDEPMLP